MSLSATFVESSAQSTVTPLFEGSSATSVNPSAVTVTTASQGQSGLDGYSIVGWPKPSSPRTFPHGSGGDRNGAEGGGGLSTGAVAGIAVAGAVAGLALGAGLLAMWVRAQRHRRAEKVARRASGARMRKALEAAKETEAAAAGAQA